jgi:hypothetical protein
MAFGASIAIDGGVVAVGAPGSGTVHIFQKESLGWIEVSVLASELNSSEFGSAVSLHGEVLAIGAPGETSGIGTAYVAVRTGNEWSHPQRLTRRLNAFTLGERLGTSIAVGDGMIAVGSPDFVDFGCDCFDPIGAVRIFELSGASWRETSQIVPSAVRRRFGASVALVGNLLAIGSPGRDEPFPNDFDRAALFELRNGNWEQVADLDAVQPPHGDEFGSAVALSKDFLVVTSPGKARGDRVTLFALPGSIGGDP